MREHRINLIDKEDYEYLHDKLSLLKSEMTVSDLLYKMPSSLFGIALDYGFDDTEVRDWIYLHLEGLQ